ncbi:hypothetical protein Tco_0152242 [Tanacetum coccineum]
MLDRGNYISWESRFRRFLDNKLEYGERMWNSIQKGPYKRPMIPIPDNDQEEIFEPLSKITKGNKKEYIADVKVMNYLLQAIPNDIYNSVDACTNAKEIWERIKRLMFASDVTSHVRHSRLMDEFDKFASKEGESLESVYERLCHASFSLQSHANFSYSPQPYCVTHPSSFIDYEDEYQGELQGDSQEDKLITAMMLLARAITQKFSTPTNNHLRTSSNTWNQVELGMMTAIKLFSVFHELSQLWERQMFSVITTMKKGHYVVDCQKPRAHDAKYFREQMLLAMKDEAEVTSTTKKMTSCFVGIKSLLEVTAAKVCVTAAK